MRALWLENQQPVFRTDVPDPVPPPGEALVRVLVAGICNTDLELIRGYYPYTGVLGHEFVGRVERGPDDLMGRRVVGEINLVCHQCDACQADRPTHCSRRNVLGIVNRDGAFADYLTLPIENLHPVPSTVPTEHAVFTEPLAAALEIQQQVGIGPDDRVLVVGDGKLGQLIAQTLALTGCVLTVVGRHAEKLSLLEARDIRTARGASIANASVDYAVECTGNPEGFTLAARAVRPRGTLVMKSTYAGALSLDAASVVVNELTLLGSRCGPFPPALALLERKAVDVAPLIHARYGLGHALEALNHARRPGTLRVFLEMT